MEQSVGMIICTHGSAELNINGSTYTHSRGSVYIQSPIFLCERILESPDYETFFLHGIIAEILPMFQRMLPLIVRYRIIDCPCFPLHEEIFNIVCTRMRVLEQQQAQEAAESDESLRRLLHTLMLTLTQNTILTILHARICELQASPIEQHTFNEVTFQFILSLLQSVGKQRKVDYFAQQAHLTAGHFSEVIQQNTGRSPKQWISMVCINQAKTLLRDPSLSVKQVAEELDFPEQFTFRKYFKHHTGLSPTDYRRL